MRVGSRSPHIAVAGKHNVSLEMSQRFAGMGGLAGPSTALLAKCARAASPRMTGLGWIEIESADLWWIESDGLLGRSKTWLGDVWRLGCWSPECLASAADARDFEVGDLPQA